MQLCLWVLPCDSRCLGLPRASYPSPQLRHQGPPGGPAPAPGPGNPFLATSQGHPGAHLLHFQLSAVTVLCSPVQCLDNQGFPDDVWIQGKENAEPFNRLPPGPGAGTESQSSTSSTKVLVIYILRGDKKRGGSPTHWFSVFNSSVPLGLCPHWASVSLLSRKGLSTQRHKGYLQTGGLCSHFSEASQGQASRPSTREDTGPTEGQGPTGQLDLHPAPRGTPSTGPGQGLGEGLEVQKDGMGTPNVIFTIVLVFSCPQAPVAGDPPDLHSDLPTPASSAHPQSGPHSWCRWAKGPGSSPVSPWLP